MSDILTELLGSVRAVDFPPEHVDRYVRRRLKSEGSKHDAKVGKRRSRRSSGVLRRAFRYAVERGVLRFAPHIETPGVNPEGTKEIPVADYFTKTLPKMTAADARNFVEWMLLTVRRPKGDRRAALGARPSTLQGLVFARGLGLVAAGIALGLPGAIALSRGLAATVSGVPPVEPWTLAAAAGLLAVVGLGACAGPAVRVARARITAALRAESGEPDDLLEACRERRSRQYVAGPSFQSPLATPPVTLISSRGLTPAQSLELIGAVGVAAQGAPVVGGWKEEYRLAGDRSATSRSVVLRTRERLAQGALAASRHARVPR